jgi:hypothetical protein
MYTREMTMATIRIRRTTGATIRAIGISVVKEVQVTKQSYT